MKHQPSEYLSDRAAQRRLAALRERIALEVVYSAADGVWTFPPESDYWKLPESERDIIAAEMNRSRGGEL